MARSKARKPKYYVAQTGGATSVPVNNVPDPWSAQFVPSQNPNWSFDQSRGKLDQQPYAGNDSNINTATIPQPAINTANAVPPSPSPLAVATNPGSFNKPKTTQSNLGRNTVAGFNGIAGAVTSIADQLGNNRENKRDQQIWLNTNQRFTNGAQGPLNRNPAFTQYGGAVKYQVGGQEPDDGMEQSGAEEGDYSGDQILGMLKAGGWIKGAINPKHKGYCTPMTKATCTPRRKALAERFKHGDLHKHRFGGSVYSTKAETSAIQVNKTSHFAPGFVKAANIPEAQAGGNMPPNYTPNGPVYNMGSYGPNWAAPLTAADSANYLRDYNEARNNPYAATNKVNSINNAIKSNAWLESVYGPQALWEEKNKHRGMHSDQYSAAIESYKPHTNAQENYLNAYDDANQPGTMRLILPPDVKAPKKKGQAGGQFSPAEQKIADQYTQMGYTVGRNATGQLTFTKNGVTADPKTAAKNTANVAASQAAAGNTNVPVNTPSIPSGAITVDKAKLQAAAKGNPYLNDSNKRYYWGELMNRDFPNTGGNVKNATVAAAKLNGLDPNLLYASAMDEGMAGAVDSEHHNDAGEKYVDWSNKNADKAAKYPVDGFYNYGLDQFAGQAKDLEAKGYLPKGFSKSAFTTYPAVNEKGEQLQAPAFDTDSNALIAKSAMMRQSQDQLASYQKQTGINLSDKQKNFFMLANYNGGEGNMQKMLQSYKDKGYLKNDDFIDNINFQPASYGDIYGHVQERLQSANFIKQNGYFSQPQQNQSANSGQQPQQTTMKAGGHWIQGAIKHPGRCSNPGDARCPKGSPQYNLAMRFKHGDLHKHQFGGALEIGECEDCEKEEMKAGGKTVTRKNDYGSKSHPYPSVAAGQFAGGHRSYPIPTKENARKALYLAHIHHRPDVIAKVHKKYPGLTQKQVGGGVNNGYDMQPLKAQFGVMGGTGREDLDVDDLMQFKTGGNWIKGAVNPAHKGYCTPMTKSTCTPRRKAFAMTMKKHHGFHKKQNGGDLYDDVPQYEIDNNMLMQAGGVGQVQGLDPSQAASANVEAEKGEVYTDQQGNMNQVDPNGATHEQGGEMLPQVSRVLENTSNLRKDKVSKYLKLNPDAIKALTGLDTNSSMSHAEALVKGVENLEGQKMKIVKSMELSTKYRAGAGLDMYGENSAKLNIEHFRAIPNQQQLFDRLFDHQEMTKTALGISNDGTQQARTGGKYGLVKAQTGLSAYPGNTSGQTTPAGHSDAFPNPPGTVDEYLKELTANGVKFQGIHSNADLQNALYSYAMKNNPDAIKNMWQEGIQNYGMDKAVKAGLVYDQDDPKTGVRKGQFKPGVLDDPTNLQKLGELYPDNILGRRILNLAKSNGPKLWRDDELPKQPGAPNQPVNNPTGTITNNLNLKSNPKSTFDEPLRWYDTASATNAYMAANRRLAEQYNPVDVHQLNLKLLDPTAALASNQEDYNAAIQAVQQASPFDVGAQMANISNLASRKYALNNQVMGNYENQNAAIKNQEIEYNTRAKDIQSSADAKSREDYSTKVLESKAKQQEQKLTALDSLYKTVAENAALNRNGNLIMKMSRAFDQYGNYNGYAPSFQPNPSLGINTNKPTGPAQPAGGVQALTAGKSYYNRRTGKTLRFDGTNLVEVK